jgi:hypothetical protein
MAVLFSVDAVPGKNGIWRGRPRSLHSFTHSFVSFPVLVLLIPTDNHTQCVPLTCFRALDACFCRGFPRPFHSLPALLNRMSTCLPAGSLLREPQLATRRPTVPAGRPDSTSTRTMRPPSQRRGLFVTTTCQITLLPRSARALTQPFQHRYRA